MAPRRDGPSRPPYIAPVSPHDPNGPNVWVDCACGQRHWGRFGAAGLLLVAGPAAPGGPDTVLLQHRAPWTHEGGTWALPGGARDEDETVEQTALREAGEEVGLTPDHVRTLGTVVVDHGTWSYTYVLARIGAPVDLQPTDHETEGLAWVPLGEVSAYPLHPLFAAEWPSLLERATALLGSA
jgi:8-oxo-dGTP diphosphatase